MRLSSLLRCVRVLDRWGWFVKSPFEHGVFSFFFSTASRVIDAREWTPP